MTDLRDHTHETALAIVRGGATLLSLLSLLWRAEQRRLAREVRDWYLDTYARSASRNGTCVVVTAGPPGPASQASCRQRSPTSRRGW